ncbi:hypothetical protein KUTeg_007368 [Tegillarca granosa]|uniref:Uncharacterized protein n=1 Tax=Tegillarca granosa TaxID=220873 RepID=A0ABQ9FD26_TEGGR|nr:hypothetical protein KUTeg_007368 [Tegillarca granosa]
MRFQSYDYAAAMSGKHRGVKARIRQQKFVHCKAHCLNLAIVHACNDPCIRTMMATVQEVNFMYDYSVKRLLVFQNELADDADLQERLQKSTKLKTLCETRWTSRAEALSTFKSAYGVVIHALEYLHENGDEEEGQH